MTLAEIIEENKTKILEVWLDELKKEMPPVSQHSKSAIENNLPGLIDSLVISLREKNKDAIHFHSQKHGLVRSSFKDYSLGHIIKEYNILKATIFKLSDDKHNVSVSERNLIMYSIDQAIEQAAEAYYKVKTNVLVDAHTLAEKKAEELQLQDDHREEFIQSITHDLNNPLNNIKACISLLEEDIDISEAAQVLRIVKSSINQAEVMVNEFLDAGDVSNNNTLPTRKVEVNILEDLKKEVSIYKLTNDNEIVLEANKKDIYANLDVNLVLRAFHNLMNNALKHGSPSGKIEITCTKANGDLNLIIKNQGHIPGEVLDQIFKRYYKLANTRRGWGIGLSFVKKVAHAHNGDVVAHSDPNDGTTFTFKIPA